jgi:hypothetical protein
LTWKFLPGRIFSESLKWKGFRAYLITFQKILFCKKILISIFLNVFKFLKYFQNNLKFEIRVFLEPNMLEIFPPILKTRLKTKKKKLIHRLFTAQDSPSAIHRAKFTAHNSLHPIQLAQFIVVQFTAQNSPRDNSPFLNSPRTIHRRHNLKRIIHREKFKIPLDEFLILLDFRYISSRFRWKTARFCYMTVRFL